MTGMSGQTAVLPWVWEKLIRARAGIMSWYSPVKQRFFSLEDPQDPDHPLPFSHFLDYVLSQHELLKPQGTPLLILWSFQEIQDFYASSWLKLSFHYDSICDGKKDSFEVPLQALLSPFLCYKKPVGSFPVGSSCTSFHPALFPGSSKGLCGNSIRQPLTASGWMWKVSC